MPFFCASVVLYLAFVLTLFFLFSFSPFSCLGKAVLRDCGISRISSLIFSSAVDPQ